MDITIARIKAAALQAELLAAAHHLSQAQHVEGRDLEAVLHEVDAQLEDTYAQLVELRRENAKRGAAPAMDVRKRRLIDASGLRLDSMGQVHGASKVIDAVTGEVLKNTERA